MAVTNYKPPGTAANADRNGNEAWVNWDYAKVNDNNYATNPIPKLAQTDWLRLTNFDFSEIPSGSTIDGIELQYMRKASAASKILEHVIILRKTSGQVGDNKAGAAWWDTTEETMTHGGASDTWNAGLSASEIKNSDFGVDISASNTDNDDPRTSYIDFCQIRIYYTIPIIEVSVTDGLKAGDTLIRNMTALLSVTDGLSGGDASGQDSLLALFDGTKLSDTLSMSMQALLSLTDGTKFGDTPLINMLVLLSDGLKLGDENSIAKAFTLVEGLKIGEGGAGGVASENQITWNLSTYLCSGGALRHGQRLTIPNRTVTELGFALRLYGLPTGDITYTIRRVSDDSIILSKVWGDASSLNTTWNLRWVIFDSPALIDEEVRIAVEFSGGDSSNRVEVIFQGSDVKADECRTRYTTSWIEYGVHDSYYLYTYLIANPTPIIEMFAYPSLAEGLKLGDINLPELLGLYLAISDGIKAGDTSVISMLASIQLSDGTKLGDSPLLNLLFYLTTSDGMKLGDTSAVQLVTFFLALTDGLKIGDSEALALTALLSLADGIKLGDTPQAHMIANLLQSDGVKLGDADTVGLLVELILQDGTKLGDVAEIVVGMMYLAITDGLKLSDVPGLAMIAFVALLEAIKLGDYRYIGEIGKAITLWLSTKTYHDVKLYTETYHNVEVFTKTYHNVIIWTGERDMTIRRDWQRGETVPIWAEVKLVSTGALYSPDQGVLIYIYDPDGTVLPGVNGEAMTEDGIGMYVYYHNTADDDDTGWYRAKGKAQDGTGGTAKVTIENSGFNLQE